MSTNHTNPETITKTAIARIYVFPIGTVTPFMGTREAMLGLTAQGWLPCDGAAINRNDKPKLFEAIGYAHGGDNNIFHLPDLRGIFLRGVDNEQNPHDPDRAQRVPARHGGNAGNAVGSCQADEIQSHTHTVKFWINRNKDREDPDSAIKPANVERERTTSVAGGSDTRPVNISAYYVIFAGL